MPLKALWNGAWLEAAVVSDELWSQVHKAKPRQAVRFDCCGQTGHAKVSRYGLRFFAHDHGGGCTAAETPEHRAAKTAIMQGLARHPGAVTETEVRSPDGSWVADVMAWLPPPPGEEGSPRVAFEVQMSPQTAAEYRRRTERYHRDGVDCVWLVGHRGGQLETEPMVQWIRLLFDENREPMVQVDEKDSRLVPLGQFAALVIEGAVRPCEFYDGSCEVEVEAVTHKCLHCREDFAVWSCPRFSMVSGCGKLLEVEVDDDVRLHRLEEHHAVQKVVTEWAKTQNMRPGVLSGIGALPDGEYKPFRCPECSAPVSDERLEAERPRPGKRTILGDVELAMFRISVECLPVENPHWCFPLLDHMHTQDHQDVDEDGLPVSDGWYGCHDPEAVGRRRQWFDGVFQEVTAIL